MKIKSKLLKLRELFYTYSQNQEFKSSFLLPFILNTLGKEMPEDAEVMVSYSFKMFIMSLIALSCFVNLVGYFSSLYLIHSYDIVNKYPRLSIIIKLYEKSTLLFIVVEILLCFAILIFMVVINLYIAGLLVYKS